MKKIIIPVTLVLVLSLLLISLPVEATSGIEVVDRVGDGIWEGDTWLVDIYPGEIKSTTITLYNSYDSSVSVGVEIIPDSLDNGNLIFELDGAEFTIEGKGYIDITLLVKANSSTTPGTYSAEFSIGSLTPLPTLTPTPMPTPTPTLTPSPTVTPTPTPTPTDLDSQLPWTWIWAGLGVLALAIILFMLWVMWRTKILGRREDEEELKEVKTRAKTKEAEPKDNGKE